MIMENPRLEHQGDVDVAVTLRPGPTPWYGRIPVKPLVIFAVFLVGSLLFSVLKDQTADWNPWRDGDFKSTLQKDDHGENLSRGVNTKQDESFSSIPPSGEFENRSSPTLNKSENSIPPVQVQLDKYLGGLIAEGFDEKSCLSRYKSLWNLKGKQTHTPSSYLISKLRDYEALHRRCGPNTKSFNEALKHLKSSNNSNYSKTTDCKYVVWISRDGLGNRMITLVSAFLYALLTQKVLLVDPRGYISDLFCEPFPGTSWLIPWQTFNQVGWFGRNSPHTYGYIHQWGKPGSVIPPYVYLYLAHDRTEHDQRFFCDEDQTFIRKVPWLIIQSNLYYAPSLFLMPSFRQELEKLFPEKETVFHFLGRYLFHPANSLWSSIMTYYNANLARADEKIGIQIRIFKTNPDPFDKLLEQILACVSKENEILPRIKDRIKEAGTHALAKSNKTKSVLMTSLDFRYFDAINKMYGEHSTPSTGEIIRVFQPSNEKKQRSNDRGQNMKAWEEMYLLSLTDKLVTSSKSTFGYVAQSLGGMKPWILYRPEEYKASNHACQRALSMEPCFQDPRMLNCKTREKVDTHKIVSYARHCEDMNWTWGLKLYGKDNEP